MRLALACAGRRGWCFLRRLCLLVPDARLAVCSFREEPHEPRFLDDIRNEALTHGHDFLETRKVDSDRAQSWWDKLGDVDLFFVVGWRYLISRRAYERPRLGTFVYHDSLLPRYRGFSPTVWAIRNGERLAGATLFAIADAVDAGDVVGQEAVPIGPQDTIVRPAERVGEPDAAGSRAGDGCSTAQP
jgi:methionyl-tRNA formyltransferase